MILAAEQRLFAATRIVPAADGHDLEDLTFAGSTYSVKAVIQFATSYFPILVNSSAIADRHQGQVTSFELQALSHASRYCNYGLGNCFTSRILARPGMGL